MIYHDCKWKYFHHEMDVYECVPEWEKKKKLNQFLHKVIKYKKPSNLCTVHTEMCKLNCNVKFGLWLWYSKRVVRLPNRKKHSYKSYWMKDFLTTTYAHNNTKLYSTVTYSTLILRSNDGHKQSFLMAIYLSIDFDMLNHMLSDENMNSYEFQEEFRAFITSDLEQRS